VNTQYRDKSGYRSLARNLVLALIGASTLAGCATFAPVPPEKLVQERAQARWQALIAGDFEGAYNYLPPSYRALHDLKYYRGTINNAVERKGAEVIRAECKTDVCLATVRVDAVFAGAMGGHRTLSTHYEEKWVSEDGGWWYYEKD
jgi:hypothetical protein